MKRLLLFLLLASPLWAQTPHGGFVSPVRWPTVPVSGNEILNGTMTSCTGVNGCGTGAGQNLVLSNWSLAGGCTGPADNSHTYPSTGVGLFSMKTGSCGGPSTNGIVSQPFTFQGLGNAIRACWQNFTSTNYVGPMDDPFKYTASAVDLTAQLGRFPGVGIAGSEMVIPPNLPANNGWFSTCRETFINKFTYAGAGLTFQLRWPAPGETGNNWVTNVTVQEVDYPIRTFVTSPVDGIHGYLWADILQPNACTVPGTGIQSICGNLEINLPFGSASMTVTLAGGKSPGCPDNLPILPIPSTYTSSQTVPWGANLTLFGQNIIETSPTTPYYICTMGVDNTTSKIYTYPDYKFYPLASSYFAVLKNYIGPDEAVYLGGKKSILWGAYDACTATNCAGGTTNLYNITNSGSAANAVNNFLTLWAGQGFASPQSASVSTHGGALITKNGPQRWNDLANNRMNFYLNFSDGSAWSAVPGNGDQMGPILQNASTFGLNFMQICNWCFGTGWDQNFQVTSATIPPTPTAPTVSTTGGFILNSSASPLYFWTKLCPSFWNPAGQTGNTPAPGSCSSPVVSPALTTTTTGSLSQPMEACNDFRQDGWFIGITFSGSNSVIPSGDTFFYLADANMPQYSGIIPCTRDGGPSSYKIIGSAGDGNTLGQMDLAVAASDPTQPAQPSCSLGCGTAVVQIEIIQVEPGGFTQPSNSLGVAAGKTLTMPGCTGTGTGYYVGVANGTSSQNQWKYFLQEALGSPLSCTGTFVTTAFSGALQTMPIPADYTAIGRPSWAAALSDATVYSDFIGISNGSDAANYPNAGPMVLGSYCCDEANAASAAYNAFNQNQGSTGFLQGNPNLLTFGVATTASDYKMWRDSMDIPSQDPYFGGSLSLSDTYVTGDWCRNGLLYQGQNNAPPTMTAGCSTGGNVQIPQESDIAAFGCMFGSYGTRPCPLVLQWFQKVSLEKGFPYSEIRRTCWKGIIDIKSFGNNGFGCIWWDWGNGNGADYFWYSQGNTNAYGELQKLSAQTNEPELVRALLSPTLDGSAPGITGFKVPGVGNIIQSVAFSHAVQAACSPNTMLQNSYINHTYFPFAPLAFFTAKDPQTGDLLLGFNNLCGSQNTNSTGGLANVALVTFNASAIPTGAIQIEWIGGDLNGNNFTVLGSNATCPSVTVAPNQFCVVMNDQEADLGWIRVPTEHRKIGNISLTGQIQN